MSDVVGILILLGVAVALTAVAFAWWWVIDVILRQRRDNHDS